MPFQSLFMLGSSFSLLRALRNLLIMGLILWIAGYALAFSRPALLLHNLSIGEVPAHDFLGRLADLGLPHSNKSVLFLGPSTVREGFEPKIIKQQTGLYAVNGGITSQGSISHSEMQLDVASNFGIKPDYLVLGINSRLLSLRPNPIGSTGFVDYLYSEQIAIQSTKETGKSKQLTTESSLNNKIWPANRLTQRIDYIARFTLKGLNNVLWNWNEVDQIGFSRGRENLIISSDYVYREQEFSQVAFDRQWHQMEKLGLFNKDLYGTAIDTEVLGRVIEKSMKLSPNVIIMIMPEHSKARAHLGSWADKAFFDTIELYREQVHVIDFSQAIEDRFIRDLAHLVPDGRKQLSMLTSQRINSLLEKQ
jgi:hypothetical protein